MLWDDILTESNQTHMDPKNLLQEQLQKAVLAAFSRYNVFNHIVFQGGTALRFFYGNPRFSEDLDFVCLPPISTFDLTEHLHKLPAVLEPQFPFLQTITTRMQKQQTHAPTRHPYHNLRKPTAARPSPHRTCHGAFVSKHTTDPAVPSPASSCAGRDTDRDICR
jgi:hypothetical protein